jgi:dTDP-4-dehydrorhamnose 3,5-epimerase
MDGRNPILFSAAGRGIGQVQRKAGRHADIRRKGCRMGKLRFMDTGLEGLWLIEPAVFGDDRGFFMETWNAAEFKEMGLPTLFVQDNHSCSGMGILRGMHFQKTHPQDKLVRVVSGAVFDVAVDIRTGSATFGKWYGTGLSAENKRQLFVPKGFAHGFLVMSDKAEFVYKCTDFYHSDDEGGLLWNDPAVGIAWPQNILDLVGGQPKLSAKDALWPGLSAFRR